MTSSRRNQPATRAVVAGLATAALAVGLLSGPAAGAPPSPAAPPSTGRTLHPGTPQSAGLVPQWINRMQADVASYLQPSPTRPLYAGAVVLAAHDATVVARRAFGHNLRYASGDGTELPRDQWVATREDSIFDLASVSKLFTSIVAVQQVEKGRLDLDATVASYIPAFAENGKQDVTVRQLLTHTSGLPAWLPLYSAYDTVEERYQATYTVKPTAAPGARYLYSDLNLITLGKIVEQLAGRTLDTVVADGITRPLGMRDTGYNPSAAVLDRIAATEYQPSTGRGVIRGSVHDENAWSLGGVAGHAGVFSTADDLAVLAQTLLNHGRYGKARILSPASVDSLFHNENAAFPGNSHGLGFELDQRWYMDALSSPMTAGHTGYTGTSLVLDPLSNSFVILLTNRVHPSRDWGSNNPARRAVAHDLGMSMPVRPRRGPTAWFSGDGDARTATLDLPVAATDPSARIGFDLFVDTESTDPVSLEVSRDNGATWTELRRWSGFTGRKWQHVQAPLGALNGQVVVRWRYSTDALYQGRGVYVDAVHIDGNGGRLFDGERRGDEGLFQPHGFTESRV